MYTSKIYDIFVGLGTIWIIDNHNKTNNKRNDKKMIILTLCYNFASESE